MRITSSLTVLTGIALAASSLVTPATATTAGPVGPAVAAVAASKVPGKRLKVVVSGDRLGKSAKVTVRGVKGHAKGTKRTVLVRKTKTVKRLPAGRYRVSGQPITAAGRTATTAVVRVSITTRREATARLRYRIVPVEPDTVAPGPVSGLTVTGRSITSISLAWTNPVDADLAEVIVRRAPGMTAPATAAGGAPVALSSPTATTSTDTGLSASTDYSYSVFTRDTTGNTGGPVSVTANTRWAITAIETGQIHTCAITTGGLVRCWGHNADGELGDGTTTNAMTPVLVSGLLNATAIAVGANHTCALLADHTVRCWGDNTYGKLGDGTTTDRTTPVPVPGLGNVTALVAGDDHTCALLASGGVRCWGWNANGQLGNGTTTDSPAPVSAGAIDAATGIAAGRWHTCALLINDTITCWGDNTHGKLGDGTTTPQLTPSTLVWGIDDATAITGGNSHTCALIAGGVIQCWGYNSQGQLGDGTTTSRPARVDVVGIGNAVSVSAGFAHTCALLTDTSVACWGRNNYGQIGDGTTTPRLVRVAVAGISTATAVAAGDSYSCARISDTSAACWGRNDFGQLGDGTTNSRSTPVPVVGL